MKEITELDKHEYLGIIKLEDFRDLPNKLKGDFHFIMSKVDEIRYNKGKPPTSKNNYLVLNLDDEIDIDWLIEWMEHMPIKDNEKVSDIAVALVNAVLKAKEKE